MDQTSDLKAEFTRRLHAQISDALATVDFSAHPIQPGLHLTGASTVSLSWMDRINTLKRVELMRGMVAGAAATADRTAA